MPRFWPRWLPPTPCATVTRRAGAGPVQALPDFAQHVDNLPALSLQRPTAAQPEPFMPLTSRDLGVYAVVDSADWVRRVLDSGIRTVQLRIKDASDPTLQAQTREAIALAAQTPGAQLFINDHWRLAVGVAPTACTWGRKTWTTWIWTPCAVPVCAWGCPPTATGR